MRRFLLSTFYFLFSRRSGQSLIEILIAIGIGVLLVTAAATVIVPSLKINTQAYRVQIGTGLAKELLENMRVWAEGDWHNISDLATSSLNHYYLNASRSPFTAIAGNESITVATTTYTRYFYVDDVYRDAGDLIVTSGGSYDPSTKKVSVDYSWPNSATSTITEYITRNRNNVFWQMDWSGGPGQSGPVTTTNSMFSASTKIDYSTTTGSIVIDLATALWWDSGWKNRRKITFNNAATADLINFPILAALNSSNIDYSKTKIAGQDIRFVDANNTTVLSYEIEKWDSTATSTIWIKVPQIDANSVSDYIWMYYNNPSASDSQAAASVWDGSFKGVWHLKEDPSGAAPQMLDSTSNDADGTSGGAMTSGDQVLARIDGGIDFDGFDDRIGFGTPPSLNLSGAMSLSLWLKPTTSNSLDFVVAQLTSCFTRQFQVKKSLSYADNKVDFSWNEALIVTSVGEATTNILRHFVFTRAGSAGSWTGAIYIDGVLDNSATTSTDPGATQGVSVIGGIKIECPSDHEFYGVMDEVRISNIARPADWIKADYKTESLQMNTFGNEETN